LSSVRIHTQEAFIPEDLAVDGKIMGLRKTSVGGVDWIFLAQERVQWWILLNTVIRTPIHGVS